MAVLVVGLSTVKLIHNEIDLQQVIKFGQVAVAQRLSRLVLEVLLKSNRILEVDGFWANGFYVLGKDPFGNEFSQNRVHVRCQAVSVGRWKLLMFGWQAYFQCLAVCAHSNSP